MTALENADTQPHADNKERAAARYKKFNEQDTDSLHGCFNGIIQHSFALQLPRPREFRETSGWLPRRGRQTKSVASFNKRQRRYQERARNRLLSLFEDPTDAFAFRFPSDLTEPGEGTDAGSYSWLLRERLTRLCPQPLALLGRGERDGLPNPLAWAEANVDSLTGKPARTWDGFIFAQRARGDAGLEHAVANDLLLERANPGADDEAHEVSRVLFQLWSHWRSRLFGVSLASRFFNVFLPHAILTYGDSESWEDVGSVGRGPCSEGSLLMQPFVSLVREPDRSHCRRTFTYTVILVPVGEGSHDASAVQRTLSLREIEASIRGNWGLAADRLGANRRSFALDGPFRDYCSNVGHKLPEGELTVRQWLEAMVFCTTRMRRDRLRRPWQLRSVPDDEELADKVLSSLATSRVSTVTVVDPKLNSSLVREWHEYAQESDAAGGAAEIFPGALPSLIRAVAGRIYLAPEPAFRVDRPFLDRDTYAEVAVPVARTLITTTTNDSQTRIEGSALVQSVFSGYMALGAATAQSLIRSSYHEIEARSDPKQFGEIAKEFTRDFHEIYDLDISWETYKRTYRQILEQFEIMKDYDALRRKLDMLYDSTLAEFTEWQHTRLWFVTWLLVIVAIATIFFK